MSNALSVLEEISKRFDKEDLAFIANHPKFCFTVNSYELFIHFAYQKIKKRNPHKSVIRNEKNIVISADNTQDSLYLYPSWKHIALSANEEALEEIENAVALLEAKTHKYIYLLFPKNENFKKHIPVKIPKLDALGLDYMLKLVPYNIH